MKEWWSYAKYSFADPQVVHRAVRKARKVGEYEEALERVFQAQGLSAEPRFGGF